MFSLSRKKGACLAGILMLSGAADAAELATAVTENPAPVIAEAPAPTDATEPVATVIENPAPVITEAPAPTDAAELAATVIENLAPTIAEAPAPTDMTEPVATVTENPAPVITEAPASLTTLPASATTTVPVAKEVPEKPAFSLSSEEQKRAYASGVAMARYMEERIEQQESLHITLSKDIMLAGISDTFNNQVKMSDQDIHATLRVLDEQVKILTKAEMERQSETDKAFLADFSQQDGVEKTKQGLLYLIKNKGQGEVIKDTDTVVVGYQGKLVDGTIVDGQRVDNSNQIFRVANMPPVLRDSVKLIRKGGEIQVVIPPTMAEKISDARRPGVVVIYTISVVDVNKTL